MSLFERPATENNFVEFSAGKCIRDGNMIRPDLRKGKVYLKQGEDQLLHFYWKENNHTTPEDDFLIFRDESTFTRVSQCTTGRVYLLKFKVSQVYHFYWMQNKNEDNDDELVARVQESISDPDAVLSTMSELDESASHAELMRLLDNVESQDPNATPENILQFLNNMGRSENEIENEIENEETTQPTAEPVPEPQVVQPTTTVTKAPTTTTESNTPTNNDSANLPQATPEQIEQFRQIIANARGSSQSAPISLNDVLTTQSVTPLLNDTSICESLMPFLPDELEKSVDEVRQVVKSPQFSQSLYSLSAALQTGQLGPLLSQLGLDYSAGNSVESFLNAINEQAKQNKNKNDHMDTD